MIPGALAILGASFEEGRRTKAIGAWAALSGLAMAVGPVLGGLLVEHASWRAAFLINPPVAALVLLVFMKHVPESRDPAGGRLDLAGAALATLGLGGVVYGLIRAPEAGPGDPLALAAFGVGVVGLLSFLAVEGRGRRPMVPLSLFGSRRFDGASLYTLLFYMGLTAALYFVPFLLVQVHGHSAAVAGLVFLPFVGFALALGRFAGRIVAALGVRAPLVAASLATAAGFLLFAVPGAEGTPHWEAFVPAMVLQGFGMALAIAPLTAAALDSVEGNHAGLASGVNNAVARTAGLLAVAAFGAVMLSGFSSQLDARTADLPLSAGERAALEGQEANLGTARPPEGVDRTTAARVEEAVAASFVASFRLVMVMAAGLALASALVAALLLGDQTGTARVPAAASRAPTVAARPGGLRPAPSRRHARRGTETNGWQTTREGRQR